jgi:hypothetical protein
MSDEIQQSTTCTLVDGNITPCNGMDEVLEQHGVGTRYQGVKLQSYINMKTGKHSRDLIIVKSGKHSKKGLALNFCPFCRSELIEGAGAEWADARCPQESASE